MITNLNNSDSSRSTLVFNSACTAHDGNTYAMTADGLVKIDDTALRSAEVTFGDQDFGTETFKWLPTCYAGISAATRMKLDVTVEGKTYSYPIRDYSTTLQQQRFDLGRGLRSNWYKLRLHCPDGGAFALADFTLMPQASKRRI